MAPENDHFTVIAFTLLFFVILMPMPEVETKKKHINANRVEKGECQQRYRYFSVFFHDTIPPVKKPVNCITFSFYLKFIRFAMAAEYDIFISETNDERT